MKDFLQTRKNREGIHLIISITFVILIFFLSLVGFYLGTNSGHVLFGAPCICTRSTCTCQGSSKEVTTTVLYCTEGTNM